MNIHSAFETKNFNEILNCYAVWISENPDKLVRGAYSLKMPMAQMKNPNGMRAFLQYHAPENTWESWETPISTHLSENPEEVKEKADIFARLLPGVIKDKIKKKLQKNNHQDKIIESFIQKEITFDEKKSEKIKAPREDNFIELVSMLSNKGVKSIKTPDGWEIQF